MLKLTTLASGSDGNCTYITDGKTNILIDVGISAKRVVCEISMLKIGVSAIDAIFITHEHGDHICGLEKLLARADIPVFASPGTARGIAERYDALRGRINTMLPGDPKKIGDIEITSFNTPHDTYESVGYKIISDGESAVVATDIGHAYAELEEAISGVDILLLECNYDKTKLRYSRYPQFLKCRISGGNGHLSNDECAELVLKSVRAGTKSVLLGHLSAENNTPDTAYTAVHSKLTNNGIIPGVDMMLQVAPRGRRGNTVSVGE